jgi:hypothetical protein
MTLVKPQPTGYVHELNKHWADGACDVCILMRFWHWLREQNHQHGGQEG